MQVSREASGCTFKRFKKPLSCNRSCVVVVIVVVVWLLSWFLFWCGFLVGFCCGVVVVEMFWGDTLMRQFAAVI